MQPLLDIPEVAFYSLQKGEGAIQARKAFAKNSLVDLAPQLDSLADSAAAICALDVVITVDTSIVHLAGALGKPAWVLTETPSHSDWRWHTDKTVSPWYNSVRLFRQSEQDSWTDVVERLKLALTELVQ